MAIVPSVEKFLARANAAYAVFPHPAAYGAQEKAA